MILSIDELNFLAELFQVPGLSIKISQATLVANFQAKVNAELIAQKIAADAGA